MKVPDNSETVEQITAEQEKICRNSGTVEQITVEQKLKCRITAEQGTDNSGTGKNLPEQRNREQITVEQKLKCRKNPLRILYNI